MASIKIGTIGEDVILQKCKNPLFQTPSFGVNPFSLDTSPDGNIMIASSLLSAEITFFAVFNELFALNYQQEIILL